MTGENKIITIFDSPIDFNHAMFRDENVSIELNKYMPNHRKFVYYGFKGNMEDCITSIGDNEHGTHVAGTVAGKSICGLEDETNYFNGIAPDAKILYGGDENDFGADQMAELMKQYKSKISSNSWGYKGYYNLANYNYGLMAQKNPELTFVFAAGNEYDTKGNFSIE